MAIDDIKKKSAAKDGCKEVPPTPELEAAVVFCGTESLASLLPQNQRTQLSFHFERR